MTNENTDEGDDVVDRLLDDRDYRDEFPDTEVGHAAADFMSLRGVENADVRKSDGKPAVAVRIDPELADLPNVHSVKVDHGLDVVLEEWDEEEGHILRVYRDNPPETDPAWWVVSEELADLAAKYTPSEVLDYWMMERAAPLQVTTTQEAWGEHRGVSQQAVSDNLARVQEATDDE